MLEDNLFVWSWQQIGLARGPIYLAWSYHITHYKDLFMEMYILIYLSNVST